MRNRRQAGQAHTKHRKSSCLWLLAMVLVTSASSASGWLPRKMEGQSVCLCRTRAGPEILRKQHGRAGGGIFPDLVRADCQQTRGYILSHSESGEARRGAAGIVRAALETENYGMP